MKNEKNDYEAMKRSKTFVPSGLDEVFERIAKRKQEAIDKGWIVAVDREPQKKEPEKTKL